VARKSAKKIKTPHRPRFVPPPRTDSTAEHATSENIPLWETVQLLMSNRPGFVGFVLSLLQLLGHATWIMLIWYLASTGQAKNLQSDSFESWLIVGILGVSLLLTAVALFVCLFYGLRREPRSLAVIGFFLSFFVGVLATACVFMQAIRAMAPASIQLSLLSDVAC
jgi:asparagine N-glycosylation enzyme membrane subunit Stt3